MSATIDELEEQAVGELLGGMPKTNHAMNQGFEWLVRAAFNAGVTAAKANRYINPRLFSGTKALLHPNYHDMNEQERMVHALLKVYAAEATFPNSPEFHYNALHSAISIVLTNVLGSEQFTRWCELMDEEEPLP
jgi:hypothetical protein